MAPDLNSVPPSPRVPSAVSQQQQTPTHTLTPTSTAIAAPTTTTMGSRQPSLPSSRRASQIFPMNPPPLPLASPGGAIPAGLQHGQPFPPLSPVMTSSSDRDGGFGLPMRHPRPMTPAELHLELEKEQEAVVCPLLLNPIHL
jgi:hypothetical protein